jgi:glycerol-3-phosphate O-acyltransferase/dihydroxyacetone phosphate acyltransferase
MVNYIFIQLLMAIIGRPISFIAAAASCRRLFVGTMIKGTGAIPVERPQDVAKKGQGKISKISNNIIYGQ